MKKLLFIIVTLLILGAIFYIFFWNRWNLNDEQGDQIKSITSSETAVSYQDGTTLLTIDDFPDRVQVTTGTAFAAPDQITGATLSPDNNWVAITARGASHGYGWLYDIQNDDLHPVDFQFGGDVALGKWSPDGNFMTFISESPATIDFIKVVDKRTIAEHVTDTGFVVEAPEEENLEPPFSYEIQEWHEPHTLCFTLNGTERCIDVESREFVNVAFLQKYDLQRPQNFTTSTEFNLTKGTFDTLVCGHVATSTERTFGQLRTLAFLQIHDFYDPGFRESIRKAVDRGNTVNRIRNGNYLFGLGCVREGEITTDSPLNMNENTENAILKSTQENPVCLQASFEEETSKAIDGPCLSLAEEIQIYGTE